MDFAEAFDDAGAIITLLALLPVIGLLMLMTSNIGNESFDMMAAFRAGINGTVSALIPVLIPTFILAVALWLYANSS